MDRLGLISPSHALTRDGAAGGDMKGEAPNETHDTAQTHTITSFCLGTRQLAVLVVSPLLIDNELSLSRRLSG